MLQGLILGFSNNAACPASCAPIVLPQIFRKTRTEQNNLINTVLFLLGKIFIYLSFAVLAWSVRRFLLGDPGVRGGFIGLASLVLGVSLFFYVFSQKQCELQRINGFLKMGCIKKLPYHPWLFGVFSGVSISTPLLLIFTGALDSGGLLQILFYFGAFFVGTSVSLLPVPLISSMTEDRRLKILGKIILCLVAGFYIFRGLFWFKGML